MGQIKESKRGIYINPLFFLVAAIVISLLASVCNIVIANYKEVMIYDDGESQAVTTFSTTVEELLDEKNIEIYEGDHITPQPNTKLEKYQDITIKRAVPVFVTIDSEEREIMTSASTVEGMLQQAEIQKNDEDLISVDLLDPITPGMHINVIRVVGKQEIETKQVSFETIKRDNYNMKEGETKVIQEGTDGQKREQYLVVLHDGEEKSRTLVSEETIVAPVAKIVEYGTSGVYTTSGGEVINYKKALNMRATAYDLSYESCGKNPDHPQYGITYTGMKAKYGVVAVDPKTIPLYSKLYIEAADGSWVYGEAVAGDIGGLVKRDIIDLFYPDEEYVKKFGIRPVKVYILE